MTRTRFASTLALLAGLACSAGAQPASEISLIRTIQPDDAAMVRPSPIRPERPVVQLAILLDTSGSMSGLIEQAKTQLWSIVNELALTERHGVTPVLEVALYEYGKSSLSAEEGWVRQILPLTRDLDAVSAELFQLQTNGGDEYCGWVIQDASRELAWNDSGDSLKMIVIAGNEPFTQGEVDYKSSVPEAIARGIIVNTIFCGSAEEGINTGWADGAKLGDGEYTSIDHNAAVPHIDAPQDDELSRLSTELNTTYLAYGDEGEEARMRQTAQDANAAGAAPAVAAERAQTKASTLYSNTRWDLVDAIREGVVKLGELKDEDLPAPMRDMSIEEQREYVEQAAGRRAEIQARIKELSAARANYIAAERAKISGATTLGEALLGAIRDQASRVGLEKPAEEAPVESETGASSAAAENEGG
ncbi:MAG: VWA domain-containing protein [Phycisphaerales bacterium JB037]